MKLNVAFLVLLSSLAASNVSAQTAPDFGDDEGQYAGDFECDDPRFVGWGVATSTSEENIGHDASDCARLFDLGQIRLNRSREEAANDDCDDVNFGDDSSQWANDRECDDPRFVGLGAHRILNFEDIGRDASDCRALCEKGAVWVR